MKLNFLYGLFPLIIWQTCGNSNISGSKESLSVGYTQDSIQFKMHIQPLLKKNCSPCHFPGGKMYARLPFDQDTTILNHETGILKRFKNDEKTLISHFINQNKNGLSADKPFN